MRKLVVQDSKQSVLVVVGGDGTLQSAIPRVAH